MLPASDMGTPKAHQVLAKWMETNGLSQTALAEKIGRPPSVVSRIVRGDRRPDIDTAAAIEGVTGIPAASWARPTKVQRNRAA